MRTSTGVYIPKLTVVSILLTLGILLAGCAPPLTSKRIIDQVDTVEIAKDAHFKLLPLSESKLDGSYDQKITIEYGKHHRAFLSQLEIDSEHLTMVGLATFGARIFTLQFDGNRLEFATIPQVASSLDAERLLAEFQLASWPLEPIEEQFRNSKPVSYWMSPPRKLEIEETKGNRSIYFGGLKIINIDYEDEDDGTKKIILKNLERGYTLHIDQLPETEF